VATYYGKGRAGMRDVLERWLQARRQHRAALEEGGDAALEEAQEWWSDEEDEEECGFEVRAGRAGPQACMPSVRTVRTGSRQDCASVGGGGRPRGLCQVCQEPRGPKVASRCLAARHTAASSCSR